MVPQALEAMLPWRSGCGSIPISELCLSIYFLSSLGYYKMVGFTMYPAMMKWCSNAYVRNKFLAAPFVAKNDKNAMAEKYLLHEWYQP